MRISLEAGIILFWGPSRRSFDGSYRRYLLRHRIGVQVLQLGRHGILSSEK